MLRLDTGMTDRKQKARDIMAAIRHQVFRPEVTTMGECSCPCGCTGSARGSGVCADCLAHELDELTDSLAGTNYVDACKSYRRAETYLLREAEDD